MSGVKSINVKGTTKFIQQSMIAMEDNQGRESWSCLSQHASSKRVCLSEMNLRK